MKYKKSYPLRLGTTSYIIPEDILPNVEYLADKVQDIELVLFEVDDGPNNLPDTHSIEQMTHIAHNHHLTYTVHLPLDLNLGSDGSEQHVSLKKAQKVIECTRALNPYAYVLHLDGKEVKPNPSQSILQHWYKKSIQALEIVAGWAGSSELLAVENIEGYPIDFLEPVFAQFPASRCVDIGHLLLDKHDPLPYLEEHIQHTRVIHIHGINQRDHSSVSFIPEPTRIEIMRMLKRAAYKNILTIEVFNQDDLISSMAAIELAAWEQ
jgi:sugar phosphate isomerase/epimerase